MSGAAYEAIVIGAGHNGLITAAYLARGGRSVLALERSDRPGGCAATEEVWPGYRLDVGAHAMGALDRRVVDDLGLSGTRLGLVDIDPSVVSLRPGGPPLALYRDPAATAGSIRAFSPRDAERWPAFIDAMARAARTLRVLYESPPPNIPGATARDVWEIARVGLRLGLAGRADLVELMRLLPMTVRELLEEWFESDALMGAVAARGCQGIFQGPLSAGTAFVLLHELATGSAAPWDARWIRGGMGRLGDALAEAATSAGAEIRTSAAVMRILTEGGAVRGVELESGERIDAPIVASSADPARTLLGLVDPVRLGPEIGRQARNVRFRGGVARIHLALDGLPGAPAGSRDGFPPRICVAPGVLDLERAYDDAKHGRPSGAPMLDAFLPSVIDPSVAPDGMHAMSIVAQWVPYSADPDDEAARDAIGDAAVQTLDNVLPGLAERVVHRRVMTPADLESRFGLTEGNIHHGEMTLDQVFIGRPVPGWSRYEMPVAGLFLCGAGAHPGGGLTGTPGRNAAKTILA